MIVIVSYFVILITIKKSLNHNLNQSIFKALCHFYIWYIAQLDFGMQNVEIEINQQFFYFGKKTSESAARQINDDYSSMNNSRGRGRNSLSDLYTERPLCRLSLSLSLFAVSLCLRRL